MTDESLPPPPGSVIASGFAGLTEGIRSDMRSMEGRLRDDAEKVERRVTARVVAVEAGQKETRAFIELFAQGHAGEHEQEAADRRESHGTFYEFIRAADLDKARRDGALGVVRYGVELLSKHAGRIIAILAALGLLGGFASGSISIGIGQ